MFLLFSKQNKSRYQLLGIIVVSVSILKGVIVKSQLLVALSTALVRIVRDRLRLIPTAMQRHTPQAVIANGRPILRARDSREVRAKSALNQR
jgi:hypothetical protein